MNELLDKIKELVKKISAGYEASAIEEKRGQIKQWEYLMNETDFWQDQQKAREITKKTADLRTALTGWENILQEGEELYKMAEELNKIKDYSLKEELEGKLTELTKRLREIENDFFLNDKYDTAHAIMAIHAGAGGTDAQDWAEMLLRMYLRYAERKKWKYFLADQSKGQEAGIKSALIEFRGKNAYGLLKKEAGVHRLVRISPFDAEKMRHTSFALVEVLPVIEWENVEIKEEDLEIFTSRSSGHGGQSVNTTDSAVKIRHRPTGIMASCQNERSQLQNKMTALKILKAKLNQYYRAELEEEKKILRGEFNEAAWGNQARSYVIHPYKLVKDHRSGYESQEVELILNGELDEIIETGLRNKGRA